jgi:transposase-like protein
MLDRDARKIRAQVVPNTKREVLQNAITKNVKYGSKVYTDNAVPYDHLNWKYIHEVVDHSETYVRGQVHTNGLDNSWSLLKRNLKWTYAAASPSTKTLPSFLPSTRLGVQRKRHSATIDGHLWVVAEMCVGVLCSGNAFFGFVVFVLAI